MFYTVKEVAANNGFDVDSFIDFVFQHHTYLLLNNPDIAVGSEYENRLLRGADVHEIISDYTSRTMPAPNSWFEVVDIAHDSVLGDVVFDTYHDAWLAARDSNISLKNVYIQHVFMYSPWSDD